MAEPGEETDNKQRSNAEVRAQLFGVVAGIVRWVGLIIAVILVLHVILTVGGANENNGITSFVRSWANPLALGFRDLFDKIPDLKARVLVNYGLAAIFWLVVTAVVSRLIRRIGAFAPAGNPAEPLDGTAGRRLPACGGNTGMSGEITRRRLIIGASAVGVAGLGAGVALAMSGGGTRDAVEPADRLTALRNRWRDIITGSGRIKPGKREFADALSRLSSEVDGFVGKLDSAADRVFRDLDLGQTSTAAPISQTYDRLATMATAWFTPNTKQHNSSELLRATLAGLAKVNKVAYYAGRKQFANWYDWQIGSAKPLADCLVLLDEQLPAEDRTRYAKALDWFVPDPYFLTVVGREPELSTGANRVDLCQAALVQGIATRSADRIKHAAAGLPDVCKFVADGDGFHSDGSFVQHRNIAYTGSYGVVLLTGMARLVALLQGSDWAPGAAQIKNLFQMVDAGYSPVIHNGRMLDFVRGRAISRTSTDHAQGHDAIEGILWLAETAEPDTANRWHARCRGWLQRDGYAKPFDGADVPRVALFSALLNGSVAPAPEPANAVVFPDMARAVHRRAGWAFAISLYSKRIANYELTNGENLKGFHTGSGMTYLYDGDAGAYSDGFWPTVDPYRLPGITVEAKHLDDGTARQVSPSEWAGGPVLDKYAAVGFELYGPSSSLRAKKSWFCLDEYVVALGAGISCSSANRVESIVDNRNLHTDGVNALLVDGAAQPVTQGWSASFDNARWAAVDGVGGYVFLGGTRLSALREERTGSYRDISERGSTAPVTRRYLTLWLDHGANPSAASYAYLVIPGANGARAAALAAAPGVDILANTGAAQGIRQASTGITAVNFFAAGSAGGVTVSQPCAVLLREQNGKLSVAVAQPNRADQTVRIELAATGYRLDRKDQQVTVVATSPRLVLDVRTGARTASATFTR